MQDTNSLIKYEPFNILNHLTSQIHTRDLSSIHFEERKDEYFNGIHIPNRTNDVILQAGNSKVSVLDLASMLPDLRRLLPWIKQLFKDTSKTYTPLPQVLWNIVKNYLNDKIY